MGSSIIVSFLTIIKYSTSKGRPRPISLALFTRAQFVGKQEKEKKKGMKMI